uniref:Lipocalin n=1 Tax=Rhipicephalus zambeziensis TaxID=60191 RepID=A0A224YMY2_9ACAR
MTIFDALFTAFTFAAHVMLLNSQAFDMQLQEVFDITKFYADDALIWITNTTEHTDEFCKLDFVNKTTHQYTNFSRIYFRQSTMVRDDLQGIFTHGNNTTHCTTYDSMAVHPRNGTAVNTSIQTLLYSYENYSCGIFAVLLLPGHEGPYYDLRIKQSTILTPNQSCVWQYQNLTTGSAITATYNHSCQDTR